MIKQSRVFQYGGRKGAISGLAEAEAEVLLQRDYWDVLVRIENDFVAREYDAVDKIDAVKRALITELSIAAKQPASSSIDIKRSGKAGDILTDLRGHVDVPPEAALTQARESIEQLQQQISVLVTERREIRQKARARVESPVLDEQIKTLSRARKTAQIAFYKAIKKWRAANKPLINAMRWAKSAAQTRARNASGLYWGNYNRVRDDFQATLKRVSKQGRRPRFIDRERDDGCLTVQIQSTASGLGASWAELTGGKFAGCVINLTARTVDLRVDKSGNRMVLPVVIHRDPPVEARIKSVQIVWRREGARRRYYLCCTLVQQVAEAENPSMHAVGIDVGWRVSKQGLLVATAISSDGACERLHLPESLLEMKQQQERLLAHVDENAVQLASKWHNRLDELPDPYRAALGDWSPKRGAGWIKTDDLHDHIRNGFKAGTLTHDALPDGFSHWYKRHRHLLPWAENLGAKYLRARREIYRLFAHRITLKFGSVAVKKLDLAELSKTKKRDPTLPVDPELEAVQRRNRQRAGIYSLVQEITSSAQKTQTRLDLVEDTTTRICHSCGEAPRERNELSVHWTCTNCGQVFDQDVNAAQNLLRYASGEVMSSRPGAESST